MFKIILGFSFLGCVAAGLVFLVLVFHPAAREENAKFSSCRNNITSECLTDLGVDRAMSSRPFKTYESVVRMLAQMGRFDDAFALELHKREVKEFPREKLEAAANRSLASHRIAAAIRSGESLQTALDQTPSVDLGALWISALDLLGRNPYEVSIGQTTSPDDQTLIIVADIAAAIATMARTEPDPLHTIYLVHAAELQAAAGNRKEVIQLLEQIPQTENSRIHLTEDIVRLIGSETALRLYHNAGGRRPNLLLTAAAVEPDPARAVAYLDRAFEAFSTKTPWRDFSGMERTVRRSADLGHTDHALRLAREMAQKAQTEPSTIPVFPYIKAARALLAAGAEKSEIRQSLNLAPSFFSQDDREAERLNVINRPIPWGTTGLGAQARREVANLRAQLGDMNISIRMMDGLKNSLFTWNDMLTPDIPIKHLNALLEISETVLTTENYFYVRAQLSAEMAHSKTSGAQIEWARSTARDILQAKQPSGDRSVILYTSIARVGAALGDQDIESMALTRIAQAALKSRGFGDLIRAGFEWNKYENSRS